MLDLNQGDEGFPKERQSRHRVWELEQSGNGGATWNAEAEDVQGKKSIGWKWQRRETIKDCGLRYSKDKRT